MSNQYRDPITGQLKEFDIIKGLSAYESAKIGGYSGTETEFYSALSDIATKTQVRTQVQDIEAQMNGLATKSELETRVSRGSTSIERGSNLLYIKNQEKTDNGITVKVVNQLIKVSGSIASTSKHATIELDVDMPSSLDGTYYLKAFNSTLPSDNVGQMEIRLVNSSGTKLISHQIGVTYTSNASITSDNYSVKLIFYGNSYAYTGEWQTNVDFEKNSIVKYSEAYVNTVYSFDKEFNEVKAKCGMIDTPLASILTDGGLCNLFKSITCIGDSLTAGCFEHNDSGSVVWTTYDDYSYPTYLKKLTGVETVRNYGHSGCMASETQGTSGTPYLSYATSQGWITDSDKTDAYIIALGTNDITYTSFDDTSVDGYKAIINKILSVQPKAKIFCVGLPYTRNTATQITSANAKINAITEQYDNCYFLDLQTYYVKPQYVADYKAKYYINGHRNALGYQELAKTYSSYIDWIIRNNFEDFAQVQFIGKTDSWT